MARGASSHGGGAPSACAVHLALVVAQLSFGGGAIVGKFGIHGTNPALFALLREGIAGPLLCAAAFALTRVVAPPRRDLCRLAAAGAAIFANQLFFLLGLKLSDPVSGSAWQPSQPIFTMMLAVCVGYEKASCRRVAGVLLAVAGAMCMVLLGSTGKAGSSSVTALAGHISFFFNCLGTSTYVILTKELVRRHASISVTGWSYMFASVMMLVTVCVINSTPAVLDFFCFDTDPAVQGRCVDGAWSVPSEMILPLCYWVLCCSILSYFCMTWANQYAKASVVSVYTVLQPATSGFISYCLILSKGAAWGDVYGLQKPGVQDLGLVGIVLGLAVVFSEPSVAPAPSPRDLVDTSEGRKEAFLEGASSAASAREEAATAGAAAGVGRASGRAAS